MKLKTKAELKSLTKRERTIEKQATKRERLEKNLTARSKEKKRWPTKEGQYVFAHTQAQVNLDGGWIIGQVSKVSSSQCKVGKEGWLYAHIIREDQVVSLQAYIHSALLINPIQVGIIADRPST